MSLEICPKCKGKGIYYDQDIGYQGNVCIYCGLRHCTKGYMQSFEMQVTGQNGRFGIGLEFFEYENTLIQKDVLEKKAKKDLLYTYQSALAKNRDLSTGVEHSIVLEKKILDKNI